MVEFENIFEAFKNNNVELEVSPFGEQREIVRPDEDPVFHTYRILLLIEKCGRVVESISKYPLLNGRSKFAFYDFLIRYPYYFQQLLEKVPPSKIKLYKSSINFKEYEKIMLGFPEMVAYTRSPWDMNYDNYFSFMVSRQLIQIRYDKLTKFGSKQFIISLTELGLKTALDIAQEEKEWSNRMLLINNIFRKNAANEYIEKFIKSHFQELIIK